LTKRELVIDVAERLGYTQNEVSAVIQGALDAIVACLSEGQRLEIRNFGVFEVKSRDARIGRNPRTGEEVPIAEKKVATFKPGKALKEYVQDPGKLPPPSFSDPVEHGVGTGVSATP
jgi:nucleoid DNA-binding protein